MCDSRSDQFDHRIQIAQFVFRAPIYLFISPEDRFMDNYLI